MIEDAICPVCIIIIEIKIEDEMFYFTLGDEMDLLMVEIV